MASLIAFAGHLSIVDGIIKFALVELHLVLVRITWSH